MFFQTEMAVSSLYVEINFPQIFINTDCRNSGHPYNTKVNTFRRTRNNKTLRTSFSLTQNVKRIYLASFVDRLRPLDVAFPRGAPFMSP